MEVEHVKAHRTKKDKKEMSHFERFVTDGNEKADELAKAGAMLDDGSMAGARAKTSAAGARRGLCSLAVCSQFSLFGWKNGRTVKSSSRSQKKKWFSWTRKERRRNIERSGVRRPASIDARGVEEAAST